MKVPFHQEPAYPADGTATRAIGGETLNTEHVWVNIYLKLSGKVVIKGIVKGKGLGMGQITFEDFQKVDMRVGCVVSVEDFPEARKPSYKLTIDFGPEIGMKKSSGQFTKLYKKEELLGRLVVCVVNFPPKQIANFFSEALTLGFATEKGIVLLEPEQEVPLGAKVC